MRPEAGSAGIGSRRHLVQLYGREEELAAAVGAYLAPAIGQQGIALVVATPAHAASITERLADAGVDTAAAELAGALTFLDSQTAVRRFTAGGTVDPAGFGAEIGARVRQAVALTGQAGKPGPVRVFGEMVAGLWQEGHVNAALELETLWEGLIRELPFSLYCAYPHQLVQEPGDALAEVHRLHDALVSPPDPAPRPAPARAAASFAATPEKPRAARRFLSGVLERDHVCWIVDDPACYRSLAARLIADGRDLGHKPVVFGPHASPALAGLGKAAGLAVDPYLTFFGRGPVQPRVMLVACRELCELAQAEGYSGLRVIADMDWLLPARPTPGEIAALEVIIDRAARQLPVTVVCAYRRTSYDPAAIMGALSVHDGQHGTGDPPHFRFGADGGGTWRLAGDVDLAVSSTFAAAFRAALALGACTIDVSGLHFVDVAGARAIAETARGSTVPVELRGASPALRRLWQLTGLAQSTPMVSLVQ